MLSSLISSSRQHNAAVVSRSWSWVRIRQLFCVASECSPRACAGSTLGTPSMCHGASRNKLEVKIRVPSWN